MDDIAGLTLASGQISANRVLGVGQFKRAEMVSSCLAPKPANQATPDSQASKPASRAPEATPDSGAESAAPATTALEAQPRRSPSASACEPFQELIQAGLSRGRNAMAIWQDLIDSERVYRRVSERQSVCPQTARGALARGPGGDRPLRARNCRSITARDPWCAMRAAASIGAAAVRDDAVTAASVSAC